MHHISARHKCGKCGLYGHGQVECGHPYDFSSAPTLVLNSCTIIGCNDPWTHSSDGHYCIYCSKTDSHAKLCPIRNGFNTYEMKTPPTPIATGHFICTEAGMGCFEYFRQRNDVCESFFMHSDSYGQYGEDTSDLPQLMAFLYGFKKL